MSLAAHPGPVTWDDIQALPPDGRRYESIGGMLFVSAAPILRHQIAVDNLYSLLKAAGPPEWVAVTAPAAWYVSQTEWFEPDDMVIHKSDVDLDSHFSATPSLVCEVTSPSSRLYDHNIKRDAYAANRCPHYWIVDPEEPGLLALALDGDTYIEVARVTGEEVYRAASPFAVEVCPMELVAL